MQDFKISLITVTYNAENTLKRCIESVLAQNYSNIDYIIIDGGSTDGTLGIIEKYKHRINFFLSEPDNGIYDAMNKGIKFSRGDIVGTLNADDVFADNHTLSYIAEAFKQQHAAAVYGDLDYLDQQGAVIRKWRSGKYRPGIFNLGWMPPHPTFYCKKELFEKYGLYDTAYGTAADYELMLRFIHSNKVTIFYLNKLIVNMNMGGVSNSSYGNRLKAWRFDLKAMQKNGVHFPLITTLIKPLRKIFQYAC